MTRFTDHVAVVTGAGSGLGRATAHRFGDEGAAVAAVDLDVDAAEKTAAEIGERGGNARAYRVDVTDPAAVKTTMDGVAADLGRPRVLVNSAGIGGFAHTVDETYERWSAIVGVNLTGTFLMCQAALPHMLEGGGAIVNVASNAGLMGQPYSAAYCASKGGVVNLTRALVGRVRQARRARERSRSRRHEHADDRRVHDARRREPEGVRPGDVAARVRRARGSRGRHCLHRLERRPLHDGQHRVVRRRDHGMTAEGSRR